MAQGLANLVCGLFGAMGGSALIGESVINVLHGARVGRHIDLLVRAPVHARDDDVLGLLSLSAVPLVELHGGPHHALHHGGWVGECT